MAELLTLMDIGDMNLYHRGTQGADAVVKGYRSVGVGTGVEHYAVATEAFLLQFVNENALDVALKIGYLHVGKESAKFFKIGLECLGAVDAGLALAKKIEIGAVDDKYSHGEWWKNSRL